MIRSLAHALIYVALTLIGALVAIIGATWLAGLL